MHEGAPTFEQTERFPTQKEVEDLFKELAGPEGFQTLRQEEDKQGLYLWEAVAGADGATQYVYMRKGRHDKNLQASATAIRVVFSDEGGIPIGGHVAAKYEGGAWKRVEHTS
ncbi:MAG: hypothetical protein HY457_03670 [Parcubacteria group bacterium]|nr:hypothetical protein [Parcubacteria group bacterium]